jgi:type II secretory pathway component PulK
MTARRHRFPNPDSRFPRQRRGFALMLVLWLIVVLGTVATTIVIRTRETSALSGNARARVVGRYAAESGLALTTAELERSLDATPDTSDRERYLNHLDAALSRRGEVTLGDATFSVALVDVSARLDVNATAEEALTRFFALFEPAAAATTARAIRDHIDRHADSGRNTVTGPSGSQSNSGGSELLAARVLRSLDELERLPGVSVGLLRAAAPYLTVDGDGKINRATASDTVLVAAGGSLQDEPSRLLIVSRGWLRGHSLTHEIQAVYAIAGNQLTLVRWRERDL